MPHKKVFPKEWKLKRMISRKNRKVQIWFQISLYRLRRLNVAAGAADASRAMLSTSCRKVALLAAIFAFLSFS